MIGLPPTLVSAAGGAAPARGRHAAIDRSANGGPLARRRDPCAPWGHASGSSTCVAGPAGVTGPDGDLRAAAAGGVASAWTSPANGRPAALADRRDRAVDRPSPGRLPAPPGRVGARSGTDLATADTAGTPGRSIIGPAPPSPSPRSPPAEAATPPAAERGSTSSPARSRREGAYPRSSPALSPPTTESPFRRLQRLGPTGSSARAADLLRPRRPQTILPRPIAARSAHGCGSATGFTILLSRQDRRLRRADDPVGGVRSARPTSTPSWHGRSAMRPTSLSECRPAARPLAGRSWPTSMPTPSSPVGRGSTTGVPPRARRAGLARRGDRPRLRGGLRVLERPTSIVGSPPSAASRNGSAWSSRTTSRPTCCAAAGIAARPTCSSPGCGAGRITACWRALSAYATAGRRGGRGGTGRAVRRPARRWALAMADEPARTGSSDAGGRPRPGRPWGRPSMSS